MDENKVKEAAEELKNVDEAQLKETIEKWFEQTRTAGMKIGAELISAGVYGIIQKHLGKKAKSSLNDYRRMTDEILKMVSKQLTKQNDSEENIAEEVSNDE